MWRRAASLGSQPGSKSHYRSKILYASIATATLSAASYKYATSPRHRDQDDHEEDLFLTLPILGNGSSSSGSTIHLDNSGSGTSTNKDPTRPHAFWAPPSRSEMIRMLEQGPGGVVVSSSSSSVSGNKSKDGSKLPKGTTGSVTKIESIKDTVVEGSDVFDLLIIGGGATGAGCAVDAATRGLKVAMVERDDFSSGTSSRSTKLVHGGVRYLEKAFRELDIEQYKLVKEALNERANFLKIAPYLSYQLPIMLPIYKWWQMPYYWIGSKAYDLLAGHQGMESSYVLTKSKALEAFPMLKNDKLVGAMVYYDGQHNDSRMNVALGLTAVQYGAVIANHVEVTKLLKDENGKLCGAMAKDTITGQEIKIKAKGVINATGPFTDGIRQMDDASIQTIVSPSAGVHIILPNYYSPGNMGLLDPATSDGRVIFFLPWQGNTIAGTTDSATEVTQNPMATEDEINWILGEVKNYLNPDVKVRRGDVLAAWSGIRPLVRDPAAKSTEGLVRNHMINVSASGLLTIAGGKWTTYRAMAAETIDEAIKQFKLEPTSGCNTERVKLVGSHGYSKTMFIRLIQQFGLETEVAQHLANSYGDRAWAVASLAQTTGNRWPVFGRKLVGQYPYIEAEVRYAVRREYACTAVDVLARRLRLAFLNVHATFEALPRVVEIMSEELGWDEARKKKETEDAKQFLTTMGLPVQPIAYPTGVSESMIPGKDGSVVSVSAGPGGVAGTTPSTASTTTSGTSVSTATSTSTSSATPAPKSSFWGWATSSPRTVPSSFYSRAQFLPEELAEFHKVFGRLDYDGDGHINAHDLEEVLNHLNQEVDPRLLKSIIEEVDLDKSGSIEFNEFLEVMGSLKEHASQSAFGTIVDTVEKSEQVGAGGAGGKKRGVDYGIKVKTTDRSGGGV